MDCNCITNRFQIGGYTTEPKVSVCGNCLRKKEKTMEIQKIIDAVKELDRVCDEQGFFRDDTLDITTKRGVEPNFELRFFTVDQVEEDEE